MRDRVTRHVKETTLPLLGGMSVGMLLRVVPPFSWIGARIRSLIW
jgi:hypothetical protein